MNKIKVIKTEDEYKEALALVEELMNCDSDSESTEGVQLNLLSAFIKDYEEENFPIALPDPVKAIKFRMEQADLSAADLVQYIGTRGRVSEILSGKRKLTLEMVRALSNGLGIPAKVLIQKSEQNEKSPFQHWDTLLVRAMESYGYFGKKTLKNFKKEELLESFFSSINKSPLSVASFRKNKISYRIASRTHKNALDAWMMRVVDKSEKIKCNTKYKPGVIDITFMRKLIKLSIKENGPALVGNQLKKVGVKLVIERHLPKTYLDGATIFIEKNNPIIGLTLRYDRLDNFWFTLMHELAHVSRHFGSGIDVFYDEKLLEKDKIEIGKKEQEADEWAEEAILSNEKWETSNANITPTPMAAQSLANELGIHVAVVAGIIRFKHQNYFYLNKIVNDDSAKVRKLFTKEMDVK